MSEYMCFKVNEGFFYETKGDYCTQPVCGGSIKAVDTCCHSADSTLVSQVRQ